MPDDDHEMTASHPASRHLRAAEAPPAPVRDPRPLSALFPRQAALTPDVVAFGPDIVDERTFRLLGNVEGKRVVELGPGDGYAAVALARQGAKVITVDPSAARLDAVRNLCDREEVRVELHQSDLAELAFIRADTVDLVLSVYSMATVDDPDRVFRQVHRVLRPESHLVLAVPHPAFSMIDPETLDGEISLARPYWDREPRGWTVPGEDGVEHPRTISDLFTSLSRANFRVDTLLEPEPPSDVVRGPVWSRAMAWVPATLILRARKEGI
jgi:SAM-dependent methyltransferase